MYGRIGLLVTVLSAWALFPGAAMANHACALTVSTTEGTHGQKTLNVAVGDDLYINLSGVYPGEATLEWLVEGRLVEEKSRSVTVPDSDQPFVLSVTLDNGDVGTVTVRPFQAARPGLSPLSKVDCGSSADAEVTLIVSGPPETATSADRPTTGTPAAALLVLPLAALVGLFLARRRLWGSAEAQQGPDGA